jgi:hypothetical protein
MPTVTECVLSILIVPPAKAEGGKDAKDTSKNANNMGKKVVILILCFSIRV